VVVEGTENERTAGSPLSHWLSQMRARGPAGWPALFVSAIGLALRIEHAITFDGPKRGADYGRHLDGVHWMMHHWRPFDFTPDVNWTISYQPPLWYVLSAVLLRIFHAERVIATLAVLGWVVRQYLLSRILNQSAAAHKWSALVALTIGAFLPISVLTDGKVNPEGLHSSLFTVAAYFLWRMEREAQRPRGIGLVAAAAFGAFAGLGVLTKGTSGLLPLAALLLVAWQIFNAYSNGSKWADIWQRLLRPNLVAGLAWCVVAGWWCGPNLIKYGHPFPHAWDLHLPDDIPELKFPVLYRRPLGWLLPFYWKHYLSEPILQSSSFPRPNAWAQFITGTYSDLINRGFCRLQGGGTFTKYWDGWPVSGRCIHLLSALAYLGLFITVVTLWCLFRSAWNHWRSAGQRGSLALPIVAVLGFAFTTLFTLAYPIDGMAATNPRYLLPIATPMAACLGIGLAEIQHPRVRQALVSILGVAVGLVAVLVIYERWGI
jgi:Dolichyl-phosphate-mannose-protein mannosyltransferase